jgi:uncharacterized protein
MTSWATYEAVVPETPRSRTVYGLISADSHVNEPPDLWTTRVSKKYSERVPRMEEFEKGSAWILEGSPEPIPFGRNACAGLGPFEADSYMHWKDVRKGAWDPQARLREQDLDGVDAEVLFPTPRLQWSISSNKDADFQLELVRAYNDWLSEYCAYAPDRLVGVALLPNRGVASALKEVERAAQLPGLRGFLFSAYPHGDLSISEEDDPVWAAIEATGYPLTVHVGLSETPPGPHTGALKGVTTRHLDAPIRMDEFIYTGVFKRFANLNLIMVETDAGWVPYYKEQSDNRWLRQSPLQRQILGMTERPTFYMDNISYTYISDRGAIANRHIIGVDHLMWSSDYPHGGGSDYPLSLRAIEGDFMGVALEEKNKIIAGNAQRLFRLG